MFYRLKLQDMKKQKKFVLNDARMLSKDELVLIEGSLSVEAVDTCTYEYLGKACVYSVSYDSSYHSTVILGTCAASYSQVGSHIIVTGYYCA